MEPQTSPSESPVFSVAHRFNNDIRFDDADLAELKARWPKIASLLVHPSLVEHFDEHERRAIQLKKRVHACGSCAVLLMVPALLYSILTTPVPGEWTLWTPAVEVLSVVGIILAFLASSFSRWRRDWLKHRYMTEVLRQWHFANLLDGASVADAMLDSGLEAYSARREATLEAFLTKHRGAVGEWVNRLRVSGDHILHTGTTADRVSLPEDPEVRRELLEAYRELRLDHQLNYAVYKVSDEDRTILGRSGRSLQKMGQVIAGASLGGALLLSCGAIVQAKVELGAWALLLTVVGIAVRAWRDGLALDEEQERYEDTAQQLMTIKARWEESAEDSAKLRLAEQIEELMRLELRSFLRAHYRAQFLF